MQSTTSDQHGRRLERIERHLASNTVFLKHWGHAPNESISASFVRFASDVLEMPTGTISLASILSITVSGVEDRIPTLKLSLPISLVEEVMKRSNDRQGGLAKYNVGKDKESKVVCYKDVSTEQREMRKKAEYIAQLLKNKDGVPQPINIGYIGYQTSSIRCGGKGKKWCGHAEIIKEYNLDLSGYVVSNTGVGQKRPLARPVHSSAKLHRSEPPAGVSGGGSAAGDAGASVGST